MNAQIARIRFAAIVANLAVDSSIDDSSTGTAITIWRDKKGNYFVAKSDDVNALFGFTTRHNATSVVDAALTLCGF